MKSFGNCLELDLRCGKHYHEGAIRLNTGHHCLQYLIKAKQYKKIYIPYYTCQIIPDVAKVCNIRYEFYSINDMFEPVKDYRLLSDEAFLYTDYYALKPDTVIRLADIYKSQLIVDNSFAFYSKPIPGIDTFYTARKFFGVPDGAYLYTDTLLTENIEQDKLSHERMMHLLKRIDVSIEAAHADYVANELMLDELDRPIQKMSNLTEKLLMGIDYESIKEKRIENYLFLDSALKNDNLLKIDLPKDAVPMIYPFLNSKNDLRKRLIGNKVYVPTFWHNVFDWCSSDQPEYFLSENIMPLPVHQQYDRETMSQILELLNTILN